MHAHQRVSCCRGPVALGIAPPMNVAALVVVSLLAVLAFCLGSFWLLRKHTAGHTQQDSRSED